MKRANWFVRFGLFLMGFGFWILLSGMIGGTLKAGPPHGFDEWMTEFFVSMNVIAGMTLFAIGKHFVRLGP